MNLSQNAFAQLMVIAGREIPDFVDIQQQPPALPTRFHVGEGAAAALAAGATIAADLFQMRTGKPQQVKVSTRAAAASLISFMHQQFADSEKAPESFAARADRKESAAWGFFPTRDNRFVYLHPSFPRSGERLMQLLGCDNTEEAVSQTVMKWKAQDLENAIAEAGVCGAMVRTTEEWDCSEQGRALNALPVVEIIKIADSDPEPMPVEAESPLTGIRVLDITRVLAGPTCARTLAHYGAEAMRIGSPDLPSIPAFVADTGHGKRSAFLDLTKSADADKLKQLIVEADVFSQGYRTGAMERQGFGPTELAKIRPGIIYTSINCYGHEGPWRNRPGWEQLAQTVTGIAHIHGGETGPELLPCAATDYTTGYLAAFGSLLALKRRALYGGSYLVRVSLSQTGMWLRKLGIASAESLAEVSPLDSGEIASLSITSETGFGPMTHFKPAVQLSLTPTVWNKGVVPLGTHAPEWS